MGKKRKGKGLVKVLKKIDLDKVYEKSSKRLSKAKLPSGKIVNTKKLNDALWGWTDR